MKRKEANAQVVETMTTWVTWEEYRDDILFCRNWMSKAGIGKTGTEPGNGHKE